jgi:hypothetical protein
MTPTNQDLYDLVKFVVYQRYKKHSAYRSGAVIKMYKELGGTFKDDNKPKKLAQWFKEEWKDINPLKTDKSYPVYRPTKRINKTTPLTVEEIDPVNLIEQSIKKQKIKGKKNLKPFEEI